MLFMENCFRPDIKERVFQKIELLFTHPQVPNLYEFLSSVEHR